jgi:hypothetical protein
MLVVSSYQQRAVAIITRLPDMCMVVAVGAKSSRANVRLFGYLDLPIVLVERGQLLSYFEFILILSIFIFGE